MLRLCIVIFYILCNQFLASNGRFSDWKSLIVFNNSGRLSLKFPFQLDNLYLKHIFRIMACKKVISDLFFVSSSAILKSYLQI